MKSIYLIVYLLLFSTATYACQISNVNKFANEFSTSYKSHALEKLDHKYKIDKTIMVIIEHSLREKDEFEKKSFKKFSSIQEWLKSKEFEGHPQRKVKKLLKCNNGECLYNLYGGIHHNTLYIQYLKYIKINNCFQLLSVGLYDGD